MLKIECLACGEVVEIPKSVDVNNYDGQLVCQKCGCLFSVRLVDSMIRKRKIVSEKFREKNKPILIKFVPANEVSKENK